MDLPEVCLHLDESKENAFLTLLVKFQEHFSSTLKNWNTKLVTFQVKPGVSPYHGKDGKASSVHKVNDFALCREVKKQVKLSALSLQFESKWEATTFIIPNKN